MRINLSDLECYGKASEEERKKKTNSPKHGFDLALIINETIRDELEAFIRYRGTILSISSIRSDIGNYNLLARMLGDINLRIHSLKDISAEEMEIEASKWLLDNGYSLYSTKKKLDRDEPSYCIHPFINYIRCLYRFLVPEESFSFDSDIWVIDKLPFAVKYNPVNHVKSISFKKIPQDQLRHEFKQIAEIRLRTKQLGTVVTDISSFNRFTKWLSYAHPQIDSFSELDRLIMEEYLAFIRLEATERENFRTDLSHLKSIMEVASKVFDNPLLFTILLKEDLGRGFMTVYRSFSDKQIVEINVAILMGEAQVARAINLHELLGTRISGVLMMKKADVKEASDGSRYLLLEQRKGSPYRKPINDEIYDIIMKSIEYTETKYGNCEYIFVDDKNPDEPMSYNKVKYLLRSRFRMAGVTDEDGKILGSRTHDMRRTYARKLMEQGEDDLTIAKALGHSGTASVCHYRKMASDCMSKEMKDYLEESAHSVDEMTKAMGINFEGEDDE